MIHESYYWKKELYKCFLITAKFRHLKKPTEQSFVNVEKAIMMGAFIVRKLDEAQKIPPLFLDKKETLDFSISKGTEVDHLNWHKIDFHYDFDTKSKESKDWRFIINQIIHSFSFIYSFDDFDKLNGFLINSDKTKKHALFFLPLETVLRIFLTISEGDISYVNYIRQNGVTKMKEATFSYPQKFQIDRFIKETMDGDIYYRSKVEWNV